MPRCVRRIRVCVNTVVSRVRAIIAISHLSASSGPGMPMLRPLIGLSAENFLHPYPLPYRQRIAAHPLYRAARCYRNSWKLTAEYNRALVFAAGVRKSRDPGAPRKTVARSNIPIGRTKTRPNLANLPPSPSHTLSLSLSLSLSLFLYTGPQVPAQRTVGAFSRRCRRRVTN